ncbi:RNA methyltransferase [Flavobacteriaceae bacterium F08102]|nr:RNA methyltransferase [Flavobacteriaceae bacterium F08102]
MVDPALLAYLEGLLTPRRKARFNEVLANRTRHFTVVLEDIFQKHNTSAIVRSCDVFGIQDLYVIEKRYHSYVSNQVAKGAQKWIDFHQYDGGGDNTKLCIRALRKKGYQLIATTPHEESSMLADFDITRKSAFIFGVEKRGVSEEMMAEADGYLKIPMVGFTESLNVSVATAIILQSLTERLRNSTVNWQLSKDEIDEIRLDWCMKSIPNADQIRRRFEEEQNNT